MSANDTQIGGEHYRTKQIQPWDFIVANGLGFLEGNIVKYVARWQAKGGVQDLEKARHYLAKLIEVAKGKADAATVSVGTCARCGGASRYTPPLHPGEFLLCGSCAEHIRRPVVR